MGCQVAGENSVSSKLGSISQPRAARGQSKNAQPRQKVLARGGANAIVAGAKGEIRTYSGDPGYYRSRIYLGIS